MSAIYSVRYNDEGTTVLSLRRYERIFEEKSKTERKKGSRFILQADDRESGEMTAADDIEMGWSVRLGCLQGIELSSVLHRGVFLVPLRTRASRRRQDIPNPDHDYRSPSLLPAPPSSSPLQLSWLLYSLQFPLRMILGMMDPPNRWSTRYNSLFNRYRQHPTLRMLGFPP